MNGSTWIKILKQLPLSRAELETVRRFEEDPEGRQFLPISEILKSHNLLDEAVEILVQGVQKHPQFAIARVVLVREIFQRGQILSAWEILTNSPVSLSDNILAQKLLFKISLLLGEEKIFVGAYHILKGQNGLDSEIKRLWDRFESNGVDHAKEYFRNELIARGLEIRIPKKEEMDLLLNETKKVQVEKTERPVFNGSKRPAVPVNAGQEIPDLKSSVRVESFMAVPLDQVFKARQVSVPSKGEVRRFPELDSTTLAEIYEKQGADQKALAIYERLLESSPENRSMRQKVEMLQERIQGSPRRGVVPPDVYEVSERLENIEVIDRQTRFLQKLLESVDLK